jgi:hypothetical protein
VVEIAAAAAHIMRKRSVIPATAVAPKASRLEEVAWLAGEAVWSFGPEGAFTTSGRVFDRLAIGGEDA